MKIAINKCYGGFGLSDIALLQLVKRNAACLDADSPKSYYGGEEPKPNLKWEGQWLNDQKDYYELEPGFKAYKQYGLIWANDKIYSLKYGEEVRKDKDLCEVIENLGDNASGPLAKVRVVEIPDDIEYEIDNYDGIETIHEKHRSW